MIEQVFAVSKVAGTRSFHEVLAQLMEEVGELSTEINIHTGYKKREPGKDGIIGEALDVINCAIDIIYLADSQIPVDYLTDWMQIKLDKWKSYSVPSKPQIIKALKVDSDELDTGMLVKVHFPLHDSWMIGKVFDYSSYWVEIHFDDISYSDRYHINDVYKV